MDYHVINSGSDGNAVRIDDFLFDAGRPYKEIKDDLFKVKYVFISHRHSDHLKAPTVRAIKKHFPRIKIIANSDIAKLVPVDIVLDPHESVDLPNGVTVEAFLAPHDVPVNGWVWEREGKRFIWFTDGYNLHHAPAGKYDYFFVEANHDKHLIERVMNESERKWGYDAVAGSLRHLSKQDAKAFYYMRRTSPDSVWVQLHKSSRFYG